MQEIIKVITCDYCNEKVNQSDYIKIVGASDLYDTCYIERLKDGDELACFDIEDGEYCNIQCLNNALYTYFNGEEE